MLLFAHHQQKGSAEIKINVGAAISRTDSERKERADNYSFTVYVMTALKACLLIFNHVSTLCT